LKGWPKKRVGKKKKRGGGTRDHTANSFKSVGGLGNRVVGNKKGGARKKNYRKFTGSPQREKEKFPIEERGKKQEI